MITEFKSFSALSALSIEGKPRICPAPAIHGLLYELSTASSRVNYPPDSFTQRQARPVARLGGEANLDPERAAESPGGIIGLCAVVRHPHSAKAVVTEDGATESSDFRRCLQPARGLRIEFVKLLRSAVVIFGQKKTAPMAAASSTALASGLCCLRASSAWRSSKSLPGLHCHVPSPHFEYDYPLTRCLGEDPVHAPVDSSSTCRTLRASASPVNGF
jgi:hypothetical protein